MIKKRNMGNKVVSKIDNTQAANSRVKDENSHDELDIDELNEDKDSELDSEDEEWDSDDSDESEEAVDEVDEDEDNEVDDADDDLEDDDLEEEDDDVDDADDDNEDLFKVEEKKRAAELEADDYMGTVGPVQVTKEPEGKFGPWFKVTIPVNIKNPKTGKVVTVNVVANKSLHPSSRLYPIVKGIIGRHPENGFNLRELEGMKVKVTIEHRVDDNDNVWENIASIRPRKK